MREKYTNSEVISKKLTNKSNKKSYSVFIILLIKAEEILVQDFAIQVQNKNVLNLPKNQRKYLRKSSFKLWATTC